MSKTKIVKANNGAEEYSYTVMWSQDDDAFIGRVSEFPSLAAHGKTQEKALREIRSVVEYVLEDLAAEREPIPEPLGKRRYSGKLNLRMSKELHRRLALESSTQGVSLNSLINTKLARSKRLRSAVEVMASGFGSGYIVYSLRGKVSDSQKQPRRFWPHGSASAKAAGFDSDKRCPSPARNRPGS
ncbi:hypothetical protein BH20ACI2_BH20ACI2_25100 [soil metagenome]